MVGIQNKDYGGRILKDIIRIIKRLFGKYETNCEYWMNTKDIVIPEYYKRTPVGKYKWKHKLNYWRKTGEFESRIILNKDFVLVDGFSSAKIAYLNKVDKVPVYFVD